MMDAATEFAECCGYQRWFVDEGWVNIQTAVDNLQLLAECAGYVDELGQDECQRLMSEAFAPAVELPSDYARQLVMQWELNDPRDSWRWTGELPPKPEPQPEWPARRPYKTPEATINAFNYVMALGDPDRLAAWLRNHPDDAPALLDTLEAA
ncbi:hypothetical protein V1283_003297 [Bradyrhizobium sp. AZCC 2262]|uniref:hypothetical protein n=1 Tax=Bradyrhizobium sp. AZCC 2262 TaxID=3117022 RepID=UPI002FF42154